MSITAGMVKELRERTGAGMMECKKALVESNGDIEAAIDAMRKSGAAKAAKKSGRTAAEGVIVVEISADRHHGVIVEVNCETDFVAKDSNFVEFAHAVGKTLLNSDVTDIDALGALPLAGKSGSTVESARAELVAKIGENVQVRRFERIASEHNELYSYLHGGRIGVLVETNGANETLGRDLAMHIAASKPLYVNSTDVDQSLLDHEREIYSAQAQESGKPAQIIAKMVDGRIAKYLKEITLLGQPFIKDPDTSVEKLLKDANAEVARFFRVEVGEGIEKKVENFAEEVMAQVRGN